MDFMETIAAARDAITVKRVYGDPYERNGVVVIPAAAVQGGGGGGGDDQGEGQTSGGGGFGLRARPVGAYVIRGEQVSWEPAIDLSKIILRGQLVALAALLVVRSIARRRR
ncbi:MAG: spore germination protein GerW family protein [Solirubrobacteraceae bacterium]